MFYTLKSATDCFGFKLSCVDFVRVAYNTELEERGRYLLLLYKTGLAEPVSEYDVSVLHLEDRHKLFDDILRCISSNVSGEFVIR